MKARALLHLMLASGRSARTHVPVAEAARIDEVCDSLEVEKVGSGRLELRYRLDRTEQVREVASRRFHFYLRGDVPALVARRPESLDARGVNWVEVHRLWGEIVDDPGLADGLVTGRAIPGPPPPALPSLLAPAMGAAAAAGIVVMAGGPVALAVGLASVAASFAHATTRRAPQASAIVLGGIGAATTLAVAAGGPSGLDHLGSPAAGIALAAATTTLLPTARRSGWAHRFGLIGSVVAVALAAAATSPAWMVLSGVLFAADLVATELRGERLRGATATFAASIGAALAIAVRLIVDIAEPPDAGGAWAAVWATLLVIVLASTGVSMPFGVRDRLSGWLVPLGCVAVGIVNPGARDTIAWSAGVAIIAVGHGLAARRADLAVEPAPVEHATPGVAVDVPRRRVPVG